ncbi:MAG: competence protein ComEC [Bacteroidales bacterium]|nr:competence protein ComEC [Bacteroidales bacterium]
MFERFLHQTPFFRFTIPLIAGIVFQIIFPQTSLPTKLLCLIIFIFIVGLQITKQTQHFYINRLWGILVTVFIFLFGIQLIKDKQNAKPDFNDNKQKYIATIIEEPSVKSNSYQTTLSINYVKDSCCWNQEKGKILAYFEKDTNVHQLAFGDQLIIESYVNPIKHSGNPNAFNYKKYLAFRDIHYQTYIQSGHFEILNHNQGPVLYQFSNKIRNNLLNIYQKNNITGDEFAVLSALTLGYKEELTADVRESFSSSGAMHILAVSGLHVGIIYIILARILFFLQRNKYGRIIQSLLIILALFFYAFLTGLSSSVLRATIMFSIVALGKVFIRQSNIYNTIFLSAFIMLLANPYSIADVGFQLSYMAVFSIIFFYPKIYGLIEVKYALGDKIWQLIVVGIAAQIGTFPLTLFYFNQFPVYFILANIFIIPIAIILIYAAVTLFLFSFSDFIIGFLAPIVKYITFGLNYAVKAISELPFSKIQNIQLDLFEVMILMLIILLLSFFILSKRIHFFKFAIVVLFILPCYNLITKYIKSHESYFIVYNIPKISAIDFVEHNKNKLFINTKATTDSSFIKYNIMPFWQNQKIQKPTIHTLPDQPCHYYYYKNQKIIQVNSNSLFRFPSNNKLEVDYVILSENPRLDIKDLTRNLNFKMLIFDSSNNYYSIAKWEKQCQELGLNYYDLTEQGAFVKKRSSFL